MIINASKAGECSKDKSGAKRHLERNTKYPNAICQ